jgi:hypothetical protein
MTEYTVRFSDKEFVAHNLRDFARIAVFAKWYLRSQSSSDGMQCSVRQQNGAARHNVVAFNDDIETVTTTRRNSRFYRRPRTSVMRKALRSFIYNLLY